MSRRARSRARARSISRSLGRADRQLLAGAARHRSPAADLVMTSASTAANRSMLWIGLAGVLAATGDRQHRSAAAGGLLGIGLAATLVNGPLKFLWQRDRPAHLAVGSGPPLLPLPRTFSFPSGHAASAFAFAAGVTRTLPSAGPVVLPLAGTVAYSRVHTGVHYPSDVAVGASFGAAAGLLGARLVRHARAGGVHGVDSPTLDVPVPKRAVLVTSGDAGSADALGAAKYALETGGVTVVAEVEVGDSDGLAALLSDGAGDDRPLVIAAGGDGTVGAAADATIAAGAILAVLPLGTSNDVARSLGVPADPVEAALAIAAGRVCAVDAGQVRSGDGTEHVFLHAATTGLNVAFAQMATKGRIRDRFGGLTYPVAAAAAVRRYEPFTCTIECDGTSYTKEIVHLSVSNAPVFGGLLGMRVRGASMTDGLLDVIVVERLTVARLALAVADTMIGRHEPVHRVSTHRVTDLRVSSEQEHEVAVDGEVGGCVPFEFRVLPGALRVVVPPFPAG